MLNVDLLELPGIRYFTRQWQSLVFANRASRREAKAALFAELAEAAKRGVPLHVALQMVCQTAEEVERAGPGKRAHGADVRNPFLNGLCAAGLFFIQLGWLFYAILSFRTVDVERIARMLAMRLLVHVERGHSLADAMIRCGLDYDLPEVALIRAGVQWDRVPEALRRLSEFQTVESRLTMQGAQMIYPFVLMPLLVLPVTFIIQRIIPKYVYIFSDLGMELPSWTLKMISMTQILSSIPLGLFAVVGLFLVFRALLNGNAVSKVPFLFPAAAALVGGGIGLLLALIRVSSGDEFGEDGGLSLAFLLLGFLVLALTPSVMSLLERVILQTERFGDIVLHWIPFLQTPARAEAEARWLSGLALALESGVPGPDAMRSAGDICGGGFRTRSQEAARRVDAGQSIGEACVAEKVLSAGLNHRLVLAGLQEDFIGSLRGVADDSSQRAFELMNRSGRIGEVVALLVIGVLLAGFILAVYIPLFSIPMVVGR